MFDDEFDTGYDNCGSDYDIDPFDHGNCYDDPFPSDFSCAFDDSMLSTDDVGAITEDMMFLDESVTSLNEETVSTIDEAFSVFEENTLASIDESSGLLSDQIDMEFDHPEVCDNPVQSIDDDCPSVNPGSGLPMSTCSIDIGGYVYGDGPNNIDDDWL